MRILLCGADGFLGRHFEAALAAAGHQVVRGVHRFRQAGDVAMDYRHDLSPEPWLPRLENIDVVINAVGILNERQPEDFDRIHRLAPAALFAACAAKGISRVIQISALGADRRDTPYLASKAAADDCLLATCPGGVVVRPALVFGPEGASSRFFLGLASLPLVFLPGQGRQPLRPIHVEDLAALVVRLVDTPSPASQVVDAVGGRQTDFRGMLAAYRRGLGFPPALAIPMPACLMAAAAGVGSRFPGSLLNRSTWRMLNGGNTAEGEPTARLLGRPSRSPEQFIAPGEAAPLRHQAVASWRIPLLRSVLAFLWLWSAAVSLAWPATGMALLRPFGLAGMGAIAVLVGASLLDAGLGLLTLLRPSRRLWQFQMALVVGYSLLVAWQLPEFLIHPFAPIAKNLAVLAILFLLWSEEEA
ncbi:MAG TPA: SDR family oxidoreductase [Rhodocyclaceae bacterium]|nr:SDR family oxidoreductase [Rhodocyclaceae bacterium]